MPFPQVGEFLSGLRGMSGVAARCLEFTILTAARTSEATQARPEEFDLTNATWTIPASRMKALYSLACPDTMLPWREAHLVSMPEPQLPQAGREALPG